MLKIITFAASFFLLSSLYPAYCAEHNISKENERKLFQTTYKDAHSGILHQQLLLADMYLDGIGTEQNIPQGIAWLEKAIKEGSEEAEFMRASLYAKGIGSEKKPEEALKLYKSSADKGFWLAQRTLGDLYATGEGVPKDPKKAYILYALSHDSSAYDTTYQKARDVEKHMTEEEKKQAHQYLCVERQPPVEMCEPEDEIQRIK